MAGIINNLRKFYRTCRTDYQGASEGFVKGTAIGLCIGALATPVFGLGTGLLSLGLMTLGVPLGVYYLNDMPANKGEIFLDSHKLTGAPKDLHKIERTYWAVYDLTSRFNYSSSDVPEKTLAKASRYINDAADAASRVKEEGWLPSSTFDFKMYPKGTKIGSLQLKR